MKIILTQEVSNLGEPGDIVEVKNGYGRNYLIPQGFAVAWTRGGEKQVESIKAARVAREHATIEEAQDLKAKLEAANRRVAQLGEGADIPSAPASPVSPVQAEPAMSMPAVSAGETGGQGPAAASGMLELAQRRNT